jgi:hypothetical protein
LADAGDRAIDTGSDKRKTRENAQGMGAASLFEVC